MFSPPFIHYIVFRERIGVYKTRIKEGAYMDKELKRIRIYAGRAVRTGARRPVCKCNAFWLLRQEPPAPFCCGSGVVSAAVRRASLPTTFVRF
jgi:hypothetical protein